MPGFTWEPQEEEVKTVMTGFARNAVLVRSTWLLCLLLFGLVAVCLAAVCLAAGAAWQLVLRVELAWVRLAGCWTLRRPSRVPVA